MKKVINKERYSTSDVQKFREKWFKKGFELININTIEYQLNYIIKKLNIEF